MWQWIRQGKRSLFQARGGICHALSRVFLVWLYTTNDFANFFPSPSNHSWKWDFFHGKLVLLSPDSATFYCEGNLTNSGIIF